MARDRKEVKRQITGARFALSKTVAKMRAEIDALHAKGNFPHDYSLGFTNAMIFADHRVNNRSGEPRMYTRTTSVGRMVKPVALVPEGDDPRAKELNLLYRIVNDAQDFLDGSNGDEEQILRCSLKELAELIVSESRHTLPDEHRGAVLTRLQEQAEAQDGG